MLDDVGAVSDEYPIPVLLDVGLVAFFLSNLDACKASKHPEMADVLLFFSLRFIWDKLPHLALRWQSVS